MAGNLNIVAEQEEIHRHSGWLIPLALGIATLLLCALMLGWYLRPGPRVEGGALTAATDPVSLTVAGVPLSVPANYIETANARSGGARDSLALVALFPSFHGYSDEEAALFAGNAPDSPVIHLTLHGDANPLDAQARLTRVYSPYISTPAGTADAFGLVRYGFRPDSGYGRNELFAGQGSTGLVLFLCEQTSTELPSPNCLAIDRPLGKGLSHSYRFKRAYLARWRELSAGIAATIARFEKAR